MSADSQIQPAKDSRVVAIHDSGAGALGRADIQTAREELDGVIEQIRAAPGYGDFTQIDHFCGDFRASLHAPEAAHSGG